MTEFPEVASLAVSGTGAIKKNPLDPEAHAN
jgi:hypothetical protein